MTYIRRLILALALSAGLAPAFAQVPPPVPALPDTERRTTYSISASTCACNVNFALYGDSTDYANWLEVFVNGVRMAQAGNWTLSSVTGTIGSIPLPITNAVLTFTAPQTGTIQIVGARRPRRTSQFNEGAGVPTRSFNVVLSDLTAQNRELWDKTNDVTGRSALAPPGETLALLPVLANRINQGACFGSTGNLTTCVSVPSSTFVAGPGIIFTGTNPTTISTNPLNLIVNVRDYGATGNGATDDTAAVQAALTATQTIGGTTYFPPGCYKVTTGLTVSGRIKLSGAGPQGDSGGGFAGHGVSTCSTTAGSVITCASNISCFVATTNLSVQIENLQFSYLSAAAGGTVGITIQAVAGAGNANTQSSIRNVMVTGGDTGITLTNCLNFNLTDSFVLYQVTFGVAVNSPNFPSFQQSSISNSLIWGAATVGYSAHLVVNAGGDLRIINNKFSTGGANTNSIALLGASSGSQNMEPMVIAGNSSEGAANCITFSTANASFTASQIVITGNQLWCGSKSILVNSFGVSQWVIGLTITGNILTVNGAASVNPVSMDNVRNATIVGNSFNCSGGCSTSTGIALASHTTNVTSQANTYDGGFTTHVSDSGTANFVWDSPIGASAPATMGASPTTVTAGSRPETHYVRQNGAPQDGNCKVNTQVVGLLANAGTYYTIKLNPNESYICTWTTTAPTFTKDVQ